MSAGNEDKCQMNAVNRQEESFSSHKPQKKNILGEVHISRTPCGWGTERAAKLDEVKLH